MATEQESLNFSIQDTMEMGLGDKNLLNDLISPETVTVKDEEVEEIKPPVKKEVKKTEPPKKEEPKKEEKKDDSLKKFLTTGGEEEESEEVTEDEDPDKEEEEEQNSYNALAKDLFNLGVFSKDDDEDEVEINTPDEFLARFNQEKEKGAITMVNKFIGQFGEDYQNAFEAIFVKGVNPKEYYGTFNNIQDFTNLDLKDEANQIAVIKQALLDQGFESEDLNSEIERLKNYGDLESVAQKHHKVLIKKEANKLAQLEQDSQKKLQQNAAIKNQYIKNVQTVLQEKIKTKEFDGIPINPTLASELQDFLITDKYKTPSGETLTEFDRTILDLKRPENHEKKVKLALLLKVLEKDPTLSTIQRAGITKKTDSLFGELNRHAGKSSVKTEKKEKPNSWFIK